MSTPQRVDRSFGTPSRHVDRSNGTPSRNITPSQRTKKASITPRRIAVATPKRIEAHLNEDEIAELMSEDM